MSALLLVQMHGEPGSGKTTLARSLAGRLPAIHLDKDVLMSALLKARLPREVAGPASYEVLWDLAASLLGEGHSVIVDSPAYWPIIEARGRGAARGARARYAMIETRCDPAEVERRLANRERLVSNPRERQDWLAMPGTREPSRERLVLDSARPVEALVEEALAYLQGARVPEGAA
ncbi:MAG: AAA family ATPase [Hyphomicrobiales bacterium]